MSFKAKECTKYANIISVADEGLPEIDCLELEKHELVKNYTMAYLRPIERRNEARKVWEAIKSLLGTHINTFLQHCAIQRYSYYSDKKKGISVSQSIQNQTKGNNVDELLDDIRIKSIYYARILNPNIGDQIENEIISFFNQHLVMQLHPSQEDELAYRYKCGLHLKCYSVF